ncbi:hypothetical protein OKW30_003707 [Paraburkholderia sp. Clong3]
MQALIWKPKGVSEEPEIELGRWRVFETDGGTRHFVGERIPIGTWRVSSSTVQLDLAARVGITASGRRYILVGASGADVEVDYVWDIWVSINGITSARNITYQLFA